MRVASTAATFAEVRLRFVRWWLDLAPRLHHVHEHLALTLFGREGIGTTEPVHRVSQITRTNDFAAPPLADSFAICADKNLWEGEASPHIERGN